MTGQMQPLLWKKLLMLPAPNAPYLSMPYRPAAAILRNGSVEERVIFFGEKTYAKRWGFDRSRIMLDLREVTDVRESKDQLPPKFANLLYSWGENRYGAINFTLVMRDGSRFYFTLAGVRDFVSYPNGYTKDDIVEVQDWFAPSPNPESIIPMPSHVWCLYEESPETLELIKHESVPTP